MTETLLRLDQLMAQGKIYFYNASDSEITRKTNPNKWSKKEILGHLIDSAIHNLLRFTEIQFADLPYSIKPYNQVELVVANDYQNNPTKSLLELWLALNQRIKLIIAKQNETTLAYSIILPNMETADLKFLINDYVHHLAHHLQQITK